MMQRTEQLLTELITQAKEQNETLKNVLNNNNGNNNNNNGNNNKKSMDEFLKSYREGTSQLVTSMAKMANSFSMANPSSGISSFIGSVNSVVGSLGTMVPALGGYTAAVQLLTTAVGAVWDSLNQTYIKFQQLNSSGVTVEGGMNSFMASAAMANLASDSFSNMLKQNSDIVAAISSQYSDSIGTIGNFIGSINQAQSSVGEYGISQDQVADLTLKYVKTLKLQNSLNPWQLQNAEMTTRTADYIKSITELSRVAGQSVDDMMKKNVDALDNVSAGVLAEQLKGLFGADTGQKAFEGVNDMFSAMGDAGEFMRNNFYTYMTTNQLPQDISGVVGLPAFFDDLKSQLVNGKTLTKDGIKGMIQTTKDFVSDPSFMSGLQAANQVNQQLGDNLMKFKNKVVQLDPNAIDKNVVGPWDQFVNNVGLMWSKSTSEMSKSFYSFLDSIDLNTPLKNYQDNKIDFTTMFSQWMGAIGDALSKKVSTLIDSSFSKNDTSLAEKLGALFAQGFFKIGESISSLFYKNKTTGETPIASAIVKIPGMLLLGIYDVLSGATKQILSNFVSADDMQQYVKSFKDVRDFLQHGLIDTLVRFINDPIKTIKGILDFYTPKGILDTISKSIDNLKTSVIQFGENMVTTVIGFGNDFVDRIKSKFKTILEMLDKVTSPSNWLPDSWKENYNTAKDSVGGVIDSISSWWNNTPDTPEISKSVPNNNVMQGASINWDNFNLPTPAKVPSLTKESRVSQITEEVMEKKRIDLMDPNSQPNMDRKQIDLLGGLLNTMSKLSEAMEAVKDNTSKTANNTDPVVNV